MIRYALRRLLGLLGVVWGAVTLVFVLFFMLPSDPAYLMAGGAQKNPDPTVVQNIRVKYGLDKPVPVQYVNYLESLATLDFGESFRGKKDVSDIISERAPASIRLALWAVIAETALGLAIGFGSSRWRGKLSESALSVCTALIAATPVFVVAYLLQQLTGVYASQHGWPAWAQLPVRGVGPNTWFAGVIPTTEQVSYVIQPVIVLAVVSTMVIAKLTRTALSEVQDSHFVTTARSTGLTRAQALRRHGARSALAPVVTFIGIDFGLLIGSAVITEQVFSWPGLGSELVAATNERDLPVMVALTAMVVVVYGLVILASDLLTAWMNPQVRQELAAP